MNADQIAAVSAAAGSLVSAAMFLDHDREDSGVGNIKWARTRIADAGLSDVCSGEVVAMDAALRSHDAGDDRAAATQAADAAACLQRRLAA
jgi:hypothetical protein